MMDGSLPLTAELPLRVTACAPHLLVVGDALLDEWWHGRSTRLCREAPAPVVEVDENEQAPGGAANTALNAARLGARVAFVGLVGDDAAGERLRELLEAGGVDCTDLLVVAGATTPTKARLLAEDTVLARIDRPPGPWPERVLTESAGRLRARLIDRPQALVVCDYELGTLEGELGRALNELGARRRAPGSAPLVLVDAHRPQRWCRVAPDLVTPNHQEAMQLLGTAEEGDRTAQLRRSRPELLAATGAACVVVTLDKDGSLALSSPGFPLGRSASSAPAGDEPITEHRTWARPVAEKLAAGAGDTYVAALSVACAVGLSAPTALDFAQAAADVAVHSPGTAVCSAQDLSLHLAGRSEAVLGPAALEERVRRLRESGHRIVLTNGCFDMLHRGHTRYLEQARALGDVLIVAINDDSSVRRLKGPGRPINTAADRAAVLAALSSVDLVTVFGTDTASELIDLLRPDVYAKGGDYNTEMLTEAAAVRENAGEVVVLDYVPDHSTSAVVDRIREQGGPGGRAARTEET